MLSDFIPVPSIGSYYKFPDGKIIVVKYHVPEEPDIEESIGYAYTSNPSDEKEAVLDEWNSWDLTPLSNEDLTGSELSDNGDSANSDGEDGDEGTDTPPKEPNQEDPQPNGTNSEPHNKSRGVGQDPKLQELEDFLKKGPEINAQFFPFNHKVESNDVEENDIIEGYNATLHDIDKIREEGRKKENRGGFINEFLWTCGGSDKPLLRMCPIDWAKKAGMGGTILGTSVFAALSGGFAAYTVASVSAGDNDYYQYIIAVIIGIIWGLVIFNLDRYLVNSMYSDGTSAITKREWISGSPRIIIAFFLGMVIATPIELQIFNGAIEKELHNEQNLRRSNSSAILAQDPNLNNLQNHIDKLEQEALPLRTQRDQLQQDLRDEIRLGRNNRRAGYGPNAKAVEAQLQDVINRLEPIENKLDSLRDEYQTAYKEAQSKNSNNVNQEIGLSKKIEMMFKATSFWRIKDNTIPDADDLTRIEDDSVVSTTGASSTIKQTSSANLEKEFNPLFIVRWFISLLFIILEILPVINKMMQESGRYDELIDLESDTMEKLARTKDANNINILRSGRLSRYKSYILGRKVKEFEDDNLEDNIGFTKKEPLREDKNTTDNNNQEIFNEAQALAKAYAISEMRRIFGDIPPIYSQPVTQAPTNDANVDKDPSSQAKTI